MPQTWQLFRFGLVGGTGFLVDAGILQSLLFAGFGDPFVARLISIALAGLVTWRLNRAFTFKSGDDSQVAEGARYGGIVMISSGLNYLIYAGLLLAIPGLAPFLALAVASAGAMALSYLGFSQFVFKAAKMA